MLWWTVQSTSKKWQWSQLSAAIRSARPLCSDAIRLRMDASKEKRIRTQSGNATLQRIPELELAIIGGWAELEMIVILTGNWQIHGSAVLAAASFLWLAGHEKFFISMCTPAVLQMCCFRHCMILSNAVSPANRRSLLNCVLCQMVRCVWSLVFWHCCPHFFMFVGFLQHVQWTEGPRWCKLINLCDTLRWLHPSMCAVELLLSFQLRACVLSAVDLVTRELHDA